MKIYLVGGAVRDKLLGLPVKEKDWVVVGATVNEMLKLGYRQVGKEFPVFLHPQSNEEYALARMERKVNPGYKGFTFDTSPNVTLEEDLIRRDLTINAMAIDMTTGTLVDPYQGQQDLEDKILRHVSPAFSEDPVRILRIGRFLARYAHLGFHIAPETMALMRDMVKAGEVDALVAERVWKELERALGEPNPEKFFEVLNHAHALAILFPLLQMNGHGMQALSAATKQNANPIVRFAALLHDIPDPRTNIATLCNRYRIPNAYHELAKLTAMHYQTALESKTLSAEALLSLYASIDIFRREERFHYFIQACEAIALARDSLFDPQWLMDGAEVATDIDVQALIRNGFEGNALATELKKERKLNIERWLMQFKKPSR